MIEMPLVEDGPDGSALFSTDRVYRYGLSRFLPPDLTAVNGHVNFVMLNPSTADAFENDPTVRRCIGYAQRWGYDTLSVTNLYGLRSTDPAALKTHPDPVGPDNLEHLALHAAAANLVVCAWGAHAEPDHAALVIRILKAAIQGGKLHCLSLTQGGQPRHPLYMPADLDPIDLDEAICNG